MRLIWVVIPLVLFGIIGVQESFAESQVTVSGNGVQLLESKIENTMLVIIVDAQNDAYVDIMIPNDVWFISGSDCKPARPFLLIDGEETDFEMLSTETTSNYAFFIPAGSEQIEFAYTFLLDGSPTVYDIGKECWDVGKIKFLPPFKQVKNGVSPFDIACKEDLILIHSFDYELVENIPYCVKPETAKKLDERDWIKDPPTSNLPGRYDVHVSSVQITDISGNSMPYANLNQETLIIADLVYNKYKDQPLVYAVEINNPDGTVNIHQIKDTLKMGQSLSPSIVWIPNQIGTHQIELFFWESTNPLITIGPPSFHTIEVKGE